MNGGTAVTKTTLQSDRHHYESNDSNEEFETRTTAIPTHSHDDEELFVPTNRMLSQSFDVSRLYHHRRGDSNRISQQQQLQQMNIQRRIQEVRNQQKKQQQQQQQHKEETDIRVSTILQQPYHHIVRWGNDNNGNNNVVEQQQQQQREQSDAKNTILFAGYLYKRSNHPYNKNTRVKKRRQQREVQQQSQSSVLSNPPTLPFISTTSSQEDVVADYDATLFLSSYRKSPFFYGDDEVHSPRIVDEQQQQDEGFLFITSFFGIDLPVVPLILPPLIRRTSNQYDSIIKDTTVENGTQVPQQPILSSSISINTIKPISLPSRVSKSSNDYSSTMYCNNERRDDTLQKLDINGIDVLDDDECDDADDNELDDDTFDLNNSVIDPIDNHIWRKKYCILDATNNFGTLYFYSNEDIAQSEQAVYERQQHNHQMGDDDDSNTVINDRDIILNKIETHELQTKKRNDTSNLSKSPLPVRPLIFWQNQQLHANGYDSNNPYYHHHNQVWEKRVDLQHVGAVRSVEMEYGPFSIELSSSSFKNIRNTTDEYDRLIVRAANHDEMTEWIFQFLRCIESFVRDKVKSATFYTSNNRHSRPTAGDLHFPTKLKVRDKNDLIHHSMSELSGYIHPDAQSRRTSGYTKNNMNHSFSYGSRVGGNNNTPILLSHGHGRHTLLNERRREIQQHLKEQQQRTITNYDPISPTTNMQYAQHSIQNQTHTPSPDTLLHEDSIFVMDNQSPDIPLQNEVPVLIHQPPYIPSVRVSVSSTINNSSHMHDANLSAITPSIDSPTTTLKYLPFPATKGGKYIPPHLRNRATIADEPTKVSKVDRSNRDFKMGYNGEDDLSTEAKGAPVFLVNGDNEGTKSEVTLGGCSDPRHVMGSIKDSAYIPRDASHLKKVRSIPFGYSTKEVGKLPSKGATTSQNKSNASGQMSVDEKTAAMQSEQTKLTYDVGAVSLCGVREFNEDSYLICSDLIEGVAQYENRDPVSDKSIPSTWEKYSELHQHSLHDPSLFAIFDGHCGDHASRYAAEEFIRSMYDVSIRHEKGKKTNADDVTEDNKNENEQNDDDLSPGKMIHVIEQAMYKIDEDFCHLCIRDGREWESGSTALVAVLIHEHLIIANLGDSRGIVGRTVDCTRSNYGEHKNSGWNELPSDDLSSVSKCLWKEVTIEHKPNLVKERERIERAGGWITMSTEIPIAQLRRMEFDDDDVVDILQRCLDDRTSSGNTKASVPNRVLQIANVCGVLGVARAIGDRDLKASTYNTNHNYGNNDASTKQQSDDSYRWDSSHLGLMYPDGHDQFITGNLISNQPEFQCIRVGEMGHYDEFLLLACDGLWDVLDPDDAYRITRDLLFKKEWSAKKTASRLAELALHLGSSDNITVIVVRFFAR